MNKSLHTKKEFVHVLCKIITVSDTRTLATDKSGKLIEDLLVEKNHQVMERVIVKDEIQDIRKVVLDAVATNDIHVILLNGGTGISPRDVTIEALQPLFTKELNGFGEIFRLLSYTEDIGSSAILSRAIAGTINNTVVFAIPGSTGAVRLAMMKLILPELAHIVSELYK